MVDRIRLIDEPLLKKDVTQFETGDQLKLYIKIFEGDKSRIHPIEGTVIRKRGKGLGATFTIRKVSFGEGVETTFPVNSPSLEKIEVLKRGKVRRSKIYYLRGKKGKATRIKEKKNIK